MPDHPANSYGDTRADRDNHDHARRDAVHHPRTDNDACDDTHTPNCDRERYTNSDGNPYRPAGSDAGHYPYASPDAHPGTLDSRLPPHVRVMLSSCVPPGAPPGVCIPGKRRDGFDYRYAHAPPG